MKKVKCPDGPRFIYRDPAVAFRLYVKDWSTEWDATIDLLDKVKGGLGAKYETLLKGFFFYLDEANNSMQMEFAAIYLVYCIYPCKRDQYLEEGVRRIIDHVHELKTVYSEIARIKTEITQGKAEQKLKQLITEAVDTVAKELSKQYREEAAISNEFKNTTPNILKWLEGS